MKVFSNRYDRVALREVRLRQRSSIRFTDDSERYSSNLINSKLRTRLVHLLKFVIGSENFLEPYILLKDSNGKTELYVKNLRDFSEAELGYDIAENLNTDSLSILVHDSEGDPRYDDVTLFDLIEVLIVLTVDERREEFVSRLNTIFKDESSMLAVNGWMVIPVSYSGIGPLIPLIKNPTLKEKLNSLRTPGMSMSPQAKARNAADAVQYIFSSETKGKTKSESESLLTDIAKRWTAPDKSNDLYDLLNQQVILVKKFNNEIGNIRHTDKHTIDVEGPGMFDMIYKINLSVTELALVTEQDKYIEDKTASDIKTEYSQNYNVDMKQLNKKRPPVDEPIDLSEIPF